MRDEISLSTLAGGALEERFQAALGEILANIDDPNTTAESRRSIVITLSFKPNKTREVAALEVSVVPKLAGDAALETTAFLGFDMATQRFVAREHNPKQSTLDLSGDTPRSARRPNPEEN